MSVFEHLDCPGLPRVKVNFGIAYPPILAEGGQVFRFFEQKGYLSDNSISLYGEFWLGAEKIGVICGVLIKLRGFRFFDGCSEVSSELMEAATALCTLSGQFREPVLRVMGPLVSATFIVWALGSMRNRTNWQLTTLKFSRNILRLITKFAFVIDRRRANAATWGGFLYIQEVHVLRSHGG